MWGFPVAGGGFTRDGMLDAALLDEVRLGELDGQCTIRLDRVVDLFKVSDFKVDIQKNIKHWLWVHFAINSGVIGAAFKAGGAKQLLNSIPRLREAILAGREALEVCKARGVRIKDFEDARAFYYPPLLGAFLVWLMMKSNKSARKIMETHTAIDELQIIYRDVLDKGKSLGLKMPVLSSFRDFVEHPDIQNPK